QPEQKMKSLNRPGYEGRMKASSVSPPKWKFPVQFGNGEATQGLGASQRRGSKNYLNGNGGGSGHFEAGRSTDLAASSSNNIDRALSNNRYFFLTRLYPS